MVFFFKKSFLIAILSLLLLLSNIKYYCNYPGVTLLTNEELEALGNDLANMTIQPISSDIGMF